MVLVKLPVPGRPTNLDKSRARVFCTCSRCGWGLFGHFYTPPHISGGVLCFHVGRPCVYPSVRSPYIRPSALRFRSIT